MKNYELWFTKVLNFWLKTMNFGKPKFYINKRMSERDILTHSYFSTIYS